MNWFTKTAALDFKNQEEIFNDEINEIQRYKLDPYLAVIVKTRTGRKITGNIRIKHAMLGPVIWSHFLTFKKDQESKCDSIMQKWKEIIKDTMKEFVESETPTSLFIPYVKKRITELKHRDHIVHTNIPHVNFSYDLVNEEDWRSTIYGTRYPDYDEENFDEYYGGRVGRQT